MISAIGKKGGSAYGLVLEESLQLISGDAPESNSGRVFGVVNGFFPLGGRFVVGTLLSSISRDTRQEGGASPLAALLFGTPRQYVLGANLPDNTVLQTTETPEGRVRMRYGFSSFGELEESSVEVIKAVLIDSESKLRQSPEYLELEKLYSRLGRLKVSIREILTVILLRRIVPGRCKYCPL